MFRTLRVQFSQRTLPPPPQTLKVMSMPLIIPSEAKSLLELESLDMASGCISHMCDSGHIPGYYCFKSCGSLKMIMQGLQILLMSQARMTPTHEKMTPPHFIICHLCSCSRGQLAKLHIAKWCFQNLTLIFNENLTTCPVMVHIMVKGHIVWYWCLNRRNAVWDWLLTSTLTIFSHRRRTRQPLNIRLVAAWRTACVLYIAQG